MVFVILCGGLGTRMAQGTFPKPLTPILGGPSIKFALRHLAGGVAAEGAPLVTTKVLLAAIPYSLLTHLPVVVQVALGPSQVEQTVDRVAVAQGSRLRRAPAIHQALLPLKVTTVE